MIRQPTSFRLPPVSHVLPASRVNEIGTDSEMLVRGELYLSPGEDVGQVIELSWVLGRYGRHRPVDSESSLKVGLEWISRIL